MNEIVYIGLGSNLGDRVGFIKNALARIDAHPQCAVEVVSPCYETEPLGEHAGGWFVNAAAKLSSSLTPVALLNLLLGLEQAAGRKRELPSGPRTLDLDILFFGNRIIQTPDLVVPHPRLHERRFVLLPLKVIAPDFIHPVIKKTIKQLLIELQDHLQVKPL